VLSPRLRTRGRLCTVVPCSTTPPVPVKEYHHKITISPPLPHPYDEETMWIKADMIYTVSFERLSLPFTGKDESGKRIYDNRKVSDADLLRIQQCALKALGLGT
jgi:mRNA interferase MazF